MKKTSKKTSKTARKCEQLHQRWMREIVPLIRDPKAPQFPQRGAVMVHSVRYRRSQRGVWKASCDLIVRDARAAAKVMRWFQDRGGVVELYSYRILKTHVHPLDPDMSDVCPCG